MKGTQVKARYFAAAVPSPTLLAHSGEVAEVRWFLPGFWPAGVSCDVRHAAEMFRLPRDG
jgi:hypothetical protein